MVILRYLIHLGVIWCVSHKWIVFCGLWIMDSVTQFFVTRTCCFCFRCQKQCNIKWIFMVETYIRKKSYKKCYSKFRRWFPRFSFPLTTTEEQILTANMMLFQTSWMALDCNYKHHTKVVYHTHPCTQPQNSLIWNQNNLKIVKILKSKLFHENIFL
jgi:hypothetical protein